MYGVDAVIVGRALYEGTLDLEEANRVISNINMKDANKGESFIA